ncbi:MAG TPA: LTA synthase family protein [Rhodanobacteraceae bacterium]|nr:LTA synthase family protein [Rhodanobacteraceae bacterium]
MPTTASPPSQPRRTAATHAWPSLLGLLLFTTLAVLRAGVVDRMVGAYTGCHQCMLGPVLHHDALLWAALAALLALDLLAPWRVLRWVLRIAACLLVLIYALDLALFVSLAQRLYIADVLTFGGQGGAIGGFVSALLRTPRWWSWALGLGLVVVLWICLLWPRRHQRQVGVALLVLAVLAAVVRMAPLAAAHYVHPEIYDNVIEINLDNAVDTRYSTAARAALEAQPPQLPQQCMRNAASDRPDVVLVAVESLSSYQSALLGGSMDALPKLDALARANHYFTRFIANGFTTSGGRVALYTGRAPLPPPGLARTLPLAAYPYQHGTLPAYAHAAGYSADYFTSGDLGFVDSKVWLERIGFDTIEGAESPYYRGMQRWQFDAPADAALFDRVLDWIDKRQDARPFVATLLTVSSHPPFVNPRSGRIDPLGTFRYVDDQLASFYQRLEARGFFDHGVLLITGDHRSMTPLHRQELNRWGETAFARVPLVVAGDVRMPAVVDGLFAQTDVPLSIGWLIGAPVCADAAHGIFLKPEPRSPQFVLHASGDQRNRVGVYFDHRHASFILDGDASHWEGPRPPQWRLIGRLIAAQRIREAAAAQNPQNRGQSALSRR